MANASVATTSITSARPPPPISPPVKEEHGSSLPPLRPSETTTLVKQEPQRLPLQEQPHFISSVGELRNLSVALSAFQRRYDELQEHLDFSRTSIDTKLLQILDNEPPQPVAVVPVTKTLSSDAAKATVAEFGKSEHATDTSQSSQLEVEALCRGMCARSLRKYIISYLSDVARLREEVPAALKAAPNPAKLVLECFGRFFLQGIRAYDKDSPMIPARKASVLILEFYLLMGCNDSEIEAAVKQEAESAAVEWKKRLNNEGGLIKACEVDARGLLLLIGCFGIPKTFSNEDVSDLIRASNANEISDVLRRSNLLLTRIPDIIEGMKHKLGVEAVDIAYTFGVESRFPPETILKSFIIESRGTWKRARKASQGSHVAVNKANKRYLADLKVVIKCFEDHKIDPLKALPAWELNKKVSELEKDIADLDKKIGEQAKLKRKADEPESSKKLKSQEVKRTRFVDRGPEPQKAAAYVDGKRSYDGLTPMNLDSVVPHFNTFPVYSSVLHGASAGPSPRIGPSLLAAGVGAGMSAGAGDVLPTGSYAGVRSGILVDRVGQVINNNSQPYGWRGDVSFQERLVSQSYGEPMALGVSNGLYRPAPSMEGFVGLPNHSSSIGVRSSTSDLYQFADTIVESETFAGSRTGGTVPHVASAYHSSYMY